MESLEFEQLLAEELIKSAKSAKRPWECMDWIVFSPTRNYGNIPQDEIDRCLNCPFKDCAEECMGCKNNKRGRPAKYDAEKFHVCIEQGLTNDEIAIRFNTSKSTVIRWKSKTRQELTSMAYAYAK